MKNVLAGQVEIKSAEYTNADGTTFQIELVRPEGAKKWIRKVYEARFLGMLVEGQSRLGGSQLAFKLLISNLDNLSDHVKNNIQILSEKFKA